MKSNKLELIALVIISLVVLGAVFITFFMPPGSSEVISNILLGLGAVTYVGFSVMSFQRFDGKISILKEKVEALKEEISEKSKQLDEEISKRKSIEMDRDKLASEMEESEKERKRLEKELAKLNG
jgi:peptidoglycan hydrolase CwlO-like protein